MRQPTLVTDSGTEPDRRDELMLVQIARQLGAELSGGPISEAESRLLKSASHHSEPDVGDIHRTIEQIRDGQDPLGERLASIRGQAVKREIGQFLTPPQIIEPMVDWTITRRPDRLIDAGSGTGRFSLAAHRRDPSLEIIAIDLDPLACLICRANAAVNGANIQVVCADFTLWSPAPIPGRTAYIGNPPYVRHHQLTSELKDRASSTARRLGISLSRLAGLHIYFLLATAEQTRFGDVGCYITSAEWLDVNYGSIVRSLQLEHLGLTSIHLLGAKVAHFPDAMTTAVITCFETGRIHQNIGVREIDDVSILGSLEGYREQLGRSEFQRVDRWSRLIRGQSQPDSSVDLVPLGTVVRAHRGIATGGNRFFVMTRQEAEERGIADYCEPVISRAREIIDSDGIVRASNSERVVLAVSSCLAFELLSPALQQYIEYGESIGIHETYNCRSRRPWWSLGTLRRPPIIMTYMARRPPVFALNPDRMPILNIAHGLYPVNTMSEEKVSILVDYLNHSSDRYRGKGRTYHGGLEKFEPREVEELLVPPVADIDIWTADEGS